MSLEELWPRWDEGWWFRVDMATVLGDSQTLMEESTAYSWKVANHLAYEKRRIVVQLYP